MIQFINMLLIGIGAGSIYALMAIAMVFGAVIAFIQVRRLA